MDWFTRGHAARLSTLHTYAAANVHLIREGSAARESAAAPHPGHVTAEVRSVSPAGWPVIGRREKFFLKYNSKPTAIKMRCELLHGAHTRWWVTKWARGVAAVFILLTANIARITARRRAAPRPAQPAAAAPSARIDTMCAIAIKNSQWFVPCGFICRLLTITT